MLKLMPDCLQWNYISLVSTATIAISLVQLRLCAELGSNMLAVQPPMYPISRPPALRRMPGH